MTLPPTDMQPTDSNAEADAEAQAEAQAEATQAATNAGVARASGILALGNIASRVLGMAREVAVTNLFGASAATDAFFVATLVPRTLYDLLIGGHVNGAIIPVFTEVVTRDGRAALWRLVSALLSLLTLIVTLLTVVLLIAAPAVVELVGSGYDAPTQALAVELLRITAPALLFLSLFAVLSGALYALRAFTFPALAGAIFNLCVVLGTILLAPPLELMPIIDPTRPVIHWAIGRPPDAIRAAAFGWLIGALVQMAAQIIGLRGARLRLSGLWHPSIRRIALLYAPVMLSLILDALVRVFSYNLASQTGESSLSYMNWATTLIQFPQGLVVTAISIAILPTLARQSALTARDGDRPFKDTLGLGLRLVITLILPAVVGLMVLAIPIIDLLFEHGLFTARDTALTGLALRLYLFGLPFAAVDLLLVYAFYARQDTLTPAVIGLVSLIAYMVVALVLLPQYGVFSLMIADSVKHLLHAGMSAYILRRRLGGFGEQRLLITLAKTTLAAGAMGIAARVALLPVMSFTRTDGTLREIALVLILGVISAAVYGGLAYLLRIDELRWLIALVRRRA